MAVDRSIYLSAFRDEALEQLDHLGEGLLALENNPGDQERLHALFRNAHTVKGSGRMMGFAEIGELAHHLEDVLDGLRKQTLNLNRDISDTMLATVDALRTMVEAAVEGSACAVNSVGLASLLQEVAREGRATAVPPPLPSPAADRIDHPALPVAEEVPSPLVLPETSPAAAVPDPPTVGERPSPAAGASDGETIRVALGKVDNMLNLAGELMQGRLVAELQESKLRGLLLQLDLYERALASDQDGQAAGYRQGLRQGLVDLLAVHRRSAAETATLVEELQHEATRLRMLPASTLFRTFQRLVRDLSREQGKEVRLVIEGEDTDVDRRVLEGMRDPLMHLMRNAIDHGLEAPDQRVQQGKSAEGTIWLRAYHRAGRSVIEVEDDGRGIDPARLRQVAVARGFLTAAAAEALSDAVALRLIFRPGFSTSPIITDTSGRGVGMDVVRANVEGLRGTIEIQSVIGKGTKFINDLPLTLATLRILLVRTGGEIYAMPASAVGGVVDVDLGHVVEMQGRQAIEVQGRSLPLVNLEHLLGSTTSHLSSRRLRAPALLVGPPDRRIVLMVDELADEAEVVVKPLPPTLGEVDLVSSGTILGNGQVALVLNPSAVLAQVVTVAAASRVVRAERTQRTILVVDDSVTTREMERSILEASGYDVVTAVDGQDALSRLAERRYDLMVTDVEMPRMNGFQLTEAVRADGRFPPIPIVIVTSREQEEDKRRGIEVGAQAYITKGAFDQNNLLDTIQRLIG